MPIYFDELETILNQWKMHSFTWRGNKENETELKKRTIIKIIKLFESINYNNITVNEEVSPDRIYGKMVYNNVVRISKPICKL